MLVWLEYQAFKPLLPVSHLNLYWTFGWRFIHKPSGEGGGGRQTVLRTEIRQESGH